MPYILENDKISVAVREKGGEICAITGKKHKTEFLWSGDAAHWDYHAPVLFPIVGSLNDGSYRIDGKTYQLPQHGLAMRRDFKLTAKSSGRLTFALEADEETLGIYPCRFILRHHYRISANQVLVTRSVQNTDTRDMYFTMGEHPAFMCPIEQGESFSDYYFEFEHKETGGIMNIKDGCFLGSKTEFLNGQNIIQLSYDLFENDALVFDSLVSEKISLKSKNHSKSVSVGFKGFPYLALWSKQDAPFVCVEPWYGHGDFLGFTGDLKEKAGIIRLAPMESFICHMCISVHE